MTDDPNINPVWDKIMGHVTSLGVPRMMALVLIFVVLGGSLFWSLGH